LFDGIEDPADLEAAITAAMANPQPGSAINGNDAAMIRDAYERWIDADSEDIQTYEIGIRLCHQQ